MKSVFFMTVLMVLTLPGVLSAAVPSAPPAGMEDYPGGKFKTYFTNMIGFAPCVGNAILKGFDTTSGPNYGKRECVALPAASDGNAFAGFDTDGTPVWANAWLKSGTTVYYNGGNVGIGTSNPIAKLQVNGNAQVNAVLSAGKVQIIDVVTVGTACSSDGLMARDSVGMILSCQSGIWGNALGASGGKQIASSFSSIYGNSRTNTIPTSITNAGLCNTLGGGFSNGAYYTIDASMKLYIHDGGPKQLLGNISSGILHYNNYDVYQITPTGLLVTIRGQAVLNCPGDSQTFLYPWQS